MRIIAVLICTVGLMVSCGPSGESSPEIPEGGVVLPANHPDVGNFVPGHEEVDLTFVAGHKAVLLSINTAYVLYTAQGVYSPWGE